MKRATGIIWVVCVVVGLCGCGRQVAPEETSTRTITAQSTTMQTTTTETTTTEVVTTEKVIFSSEDTITTETESKPVEHIIKQRIHDSLPEFELVLLGNGSHITRQYSNGNTFEFDTATINAIEIRGDGFYQRLDGFEADITIHDAETEDLVFGDLTGDGYLDLQVFPDAGNHKGSSLFWLWDKKQHKYVCNSQLWEISCEYKYSGPSDDGRMYGFVKESTDKGTSWTDAYYEYIDGAFVLTEKHMTYYGYRYEEVDGLYVYYDLDERYKLIDGKLKLVSSKEEVG